MDKRVTFRFFEVRQHRKTKQSFSDALTEIANIPKRTMRERTLGQDYHVRLEQLQAAKGSLSGELTRVQRANFPAEIAGERRIALQTKNPLGHSVVFRYLPGNSQLGLQYDPRLLSPNRFMQYVGAMLDDAQFELAPIVRSDMWEQFKKSAVRKVSIAVAQPASLDAVQPGDQDAVTTAMKNMAEAYEAPKIDISISMGNRPGALSETIKGVVQHFRQRMVTGSAEVTKMSATVKDDDDSEELNLLDDILSVRQHLALTDRDHDVNYTLKLGALREAMNDWLG